MIPLFFTARAPFGAPGRFRRKVSSRSVMTGESDYRTDCTDDKTDIRVGKQPRGCQRIRTRNECSSLPLRSFSAVHLNQCPPDPRSERTFHRTTRYTPQATQEAKIEIRKSEKVRSAWFFTSARFLTISNIQVNIVIRTNTDHMNSYWNFFLDR
jgi:hypothetical protein